MARIVTRNGKPISKEKTSETRASLAGKMEETNLEKAKKVNIKFNRKLKEATRKVRMSDRKGSNVAAVDIIRLMTEQALALRELGYEIIQKDGERPKLIPFVPRPLTEEEELSKAARNGDPGAIRKFILKMAED